MLDKMGRDEMIYKIADIGCNWMKSDDELLKDMRSITNPNFQDYQGFSYLHMACQIHCIEAVKILLELGADPNINDNRGFSPISCAVGSINENNIPILKLMLDYGLDLQKREGDQTLKEFLERFNEDDMNRVIEEYSAKYSAKT